MGGGLSVKKLPPIPDVSEFRKLAAEYDRLRAAGCSIDEIHMLMNNRMKLNQNSNSNDNDNTESRIPDPDKLNNDSNNNNNNNNSNNDITMNTIKTNNDIEITKPTPKYKAMLIDDSHVTAMVAAKILKLMNFDVFTATDARTGVNLLREKSKEINVVFLDIVMPEVDGLECLMNIKKDPDIAHIPVYMLSGLEDQTLVEVCIGKGAIDMLMKPLRKEKIQQIISSGNITNNNNDNSNDSDSNSNSNSNIQTVQVDRIAPAFRLCDSSFDSFEFPLNAPGAVLFIFVPSIFYDTVNGNDGFVTKLLNDVKANSKTTDNLLVVIISKDLPMILAAAKAKFNLDCILLSDTNLETTNRYVGTTTIKTTNDNDDSSKYIAPTHGIILVDKKNTVVNKWTADNGSSLSSRPSIVPWLQSISVKSKPAAPKAVPQSLSSSSSSSTSSSSSSEKLILVVDDSSVSSRMTAKKLESAGFPVSIAYNGEIAYDMVASGPTKWKAIVADVCMPVVDGIQFLKMVKGNAAAKDIPVIMISGLEASELAENCFELGASGLLKKPFEIKDFLTALSKDI